MNLTCDTSSKTKKLEAKTENKIRIVFVNKQKIDIIITQKKVIKTKIKIV